MSHDDFATEPVPGLPERPPEGEEILWQGRPAVWPLLRDALSLWWVVGYFAVLAVWRLVAVIDILPFGQALAAALPFLVLGAIVVGLLWIVAWVQARATVYTVTNRRVAMRIGAALTVTLNLPYTRVAAANLDLRKGGEGTIAFDLLDDTRLSYLVCWPHVRPWVMRRTQPALRCIPEARQVAAIIAEAAEARVLTPQVARHPAPVAVAAE